MAVDAEKVSYETVGFRRVIESEHDSINKRRARLNRAAIKQAAGTHPKKSGETGEPIYDTTGLALSGGGVRSASFCLGALQALHVADVLKYVDYLSTVSGGGYIGTSLSAGMSKTDGGFPFESSLDHGEPDAVRHLRDYSNYLLPGGFADLLGSIAIYLRGLMASAILVLPWLLFAAAYTIYSKPTAEDLSRPNIAGLSLWSPFGFKHFVLTINLSSLAVVLLAVWGLWRSARLQLGRSDTGSWVTHAVGYVLLGILVLAFCEAQPLIIRYILRSSDGGTFLSGIQGLGPSIAPLLASLSAIVGFLSNTLAKFLKTTTESDRLHKRAAAVVSKVLILLAGAVLPLLLWIIYLQFSFWGIVKPEWLQNSAESVRGYLNWARPATLVESEDSILVLYLIVAVSFLALSWFLEPNANSLHRLYRDRLSKAFLVDLSLMTKLTSFVSKVWAKGLRTSFKNFLAGKSERVALPPLDKMKLSEVKEEFAPYHIINTALNIQGSKHVNQRARNADFFLFSRNYIGSEATDYVQTKAMEEVVPDLDLATAMAISGAAASANMGSSTIRPLTPTLTLLNIRLGFWLRNPNSISLRKRIASKLLNSTNLYFFMEMFGLLRENSWLIYLTDGGHIENLGVYELLKRRCRLIIAVDGEADPEMNFGSFVKLQRHARIDLGVRIELPWQEIRKTTLEVGKDMAGDGGQAPAKPRMGPHCAVGRILYDDDQWGILFYVKSSISGDENDYVIDYKRRHASYPHEMTGDQFFSEEQFEVYRALGFHAVHRVLSGDEAVPTHAGKNGGVYAPIMKIWKDAKFDDFTVDKAKEILRFTAEDAGVIAPSVGKEDGGGEKTAPRKRPPARRR